MLHRQITDQSLIRSPCALTLVRVRYLVQRMQQCIFYRVSTVNRLTGYDGYKILTSCNQLGNFNHSYNRLQKIEKKLAFS